MEAVIKKALAYASAFFMYILNFDIFKFCPTKPAYLLYSIYFFACAISKATWRGVGGDFFDKEG
jgi:hypothetical protein